VRGRAGAADTTGGPWIGEHRRMVSLFTCHQEGQVSTGGQTTTRTDVVLLPPLPGRPTDGRAKQDGTPADRQQGGPQPAIWGWRTIGCWRKLPAGLFLYYHHQSNEHLPSTCCSLWDLINLTDRRWLRTCRTCHPQDGRRVLPAWEGLHTCPSVITLFPPPIQTPQPQP